MPEVIHVFSEQDSKGSLLAEVHRLQSSLAAMRQARDFHGANSAYLMQERDRLQKEIEMSDGISDAYRGRNVQPVANGPCSVCSDGGQEFCKRHGAKQEAPAPVDAGLVERMGDAYLAVKESAVDGGWWHESMTAALSVAADALLGPVTDADRAISDYPVMWREDDINDMLAARRARLLAPAESDTVQERVERILTKHFNTIGVVDAAEEIIATLKQEGAE